MMNIRFPGMLSPDTVSTLGLLITTATKFLLLNGNLQFLSLLLSSLQHRRMSNRSELFTPSDSRQPFFGWLFVAKKLYKKIKIAQIKCFLAFVLVRIRIIFWKIVRFLYMVQVG
jgi:hypothetical protein